MKSKFLLFLSIFIYQISLGQEISINSGIIATAGNNDTNELNSVSVNISKWKLGEVHLITLQQNELNELPKINWNVNSYPNPFKKILNLSFKTAEINYFTIQITDITGKKQWLNKNITVTQNQVISFNLAHLTPAIYIVTITPKNKKMQRVFKVQKY